MTMFDGFLIMLAGTGPYILVAVLAICLIVYVKTRNVGWLVMVITGGAILLIPWIIYMLARLNNGL